MSRPFPWRTLLRLLAPCLALAGYFGPWIGHRTAALGVTGFELAEFSRLFPQVQGGAVTVNRVLFFLPLIAATVLAGLLTHPPSTRPLPHRLLRSLLLIPLAALNLIALPPYPSLSDPRFRGQLALVAGGCIAVFLTYLAQRLPRRAWGALVTLLALGSIVPALWQYALVRPLFTALYGGQAAIGWGLVACAAGFALFTLEGLLNILKP